MVLNFLVKIINCLVIILALFLLVAIPAGKYYEYYYLEGIGIQNATNFAGSPPCGSTTGLEILSCVFATKIEPGYWSKPKGKQTRGKSTED